MSTENSDQIPHKSRHHYHKDGTLFVQAQNTIFQVYRQQLLMISPVMRGMIEEVAEPDSPGTSAENPLLVPGKAGEFTALMNVLLGNPLCDLNQTPDDGPEDPDPYASISLLRAASLWDIEPVKDIAIRELDQCYNVNLVSPAVKLSLALSLHINHWVRPTVITLLERPLLPIIEPDIVHLGARVLTDLFMWRDKIDTHRLNIVSHYPGDAFVLECPCVSECSAQIYKCWGALRLYIHAPLSKYEKDLPIRLHASGICDACCAEVVQKLRDRRILSSEDDLIREAADWMYNRWCREELEEA